MSVLIDRAIREAGLEPVLAARSRGELARARELLTDRALDLLALGALADKVRAEEVGATVRVCLSPAGEGADGREPDVIEVAPSADFLRDVAVARLGAPRGARVRVAWNAVGLELAQVALSFGANELRGTLADKRGLPLANGQMLGVGKRSERVPAALQKQRELAALLERGGRTVVFVPAVDLSAGAVEVVT